MFKFRALGVENVKGKLHEEFDFSCFAARCSTRVDQTPSPEHNILIFKSLMRLYASMPFVSYQANKADERNRKPCACRSWLAPPGIPQGFRCTTRHNTATVQRITGP